MKIKTLLLTALLSTNAFASSPMWHTVDESNGTKMSVKMSPNNSRYKGQYISSTMSISMNMNKDISENLCGHGMLYDVMSFDNKQLKISYKCDSTDTKLTVNGRHAAFTYHKFSSDVVEYSFRGISGSFDVSGYNAALTEYTSVMFPSK